MTTKKIFTQIIGLLIAFYSAANDYPVTVRGSVFGIDWAYSEKKKFPLMGAIVELVDSDADGSQIFDDVMGRAIVNPDGSFEVSGRGGDPGSYSWSKPDVYLRFVYNYNGKVRLTDELDRTRYASTPEHDHNDFEGTLNFGTWVIEDDISQGESSQAAIWYRVCRAWDDYVSVMGEEPKPGYVDVEYWSAIYAGTPWTNDNTIHWPIHYSSSAAKHEFGHIIRHSFDGDRNHFNWDVNRFRYGREHSQCAGNCSNWMTETKEMNEAFAFNEGWAEFWAREYNCDMNLSTQCEGGVAHTLKEIEEKLAATMPNARQFMVLVLKDNPNAIHSIGDYVNRMNARAASTLYSLRTTEQAPMEKNIPPQVSQGASTMEKNIPPQKGQKRPPRTIGKNILPQASQEESPKTVKTPPVEKQIQDQPQTVEKKDLTPVNPKGIIMSNNARVRAAISTTNAKLGLKTGGEMKVMSIPCPEGVCNWKTEKALDITGLSTQRNFLQLEQEMFENSGQLSSPQDLYKMRQDNSFDGYMQAFRSSYNARINGIIQQAYKDLISNLKTSAEPDAYKDAVLADIQNKYSRMSGKTKVNSSPQYSFSKTATITRSE